MPKKSGDEIKRSKWPPIISFIIAVLSIGAYFVLPDFQDFIDNAFEVLTSEDEERISSWVSQFGFWGPLVIIFAMVAQMVVLVVPTPLLMVVAILAYGPIWGGILSIVAMMVASSVAFAIGNLLGDVSLDKLIGGKTKNKVEKYVDKYGFWAVIIARASPIFSNDAVSLVAGFTGMNYWYFIGATFAGILPLTILIAYLGESIDRLESGFIWISIVGIILFVAYVLYDRYKNK